MYYYYLELRVRLSPHGRIKPIKYFIKQTDSDRYQYRIANAEFSDILTACANYFSKFKFTWFTPDLQFFKKVLKVPASRGPYIQYKLICTENKLPDNSVISKESAIEYIIKYNCCYSIEKLFYRYNPTFEHGNTSFNNKGIADIKIMNDIKFKKLKDYGLVDIAAGFESYKSGNHLLAEQLYDTYQKYKNDPKLFDKAYDGLFQLIIKQLPNY